MSPVDVDVERREFVVERIAHKALGRQMVTLVGAHALENPVEAGEALERSRMQMQTV